MRHIINISLLLVFTTLAISGILSYICPFDLDTTRVHIVFGFVTLILIGLHLWDKKAYFKAIFSHRSSLFIPKRTLGLIFSLWLILLLSSLYNYAPAKQIMAKSYESRESHQIVRPNPLIKSISESNSHSTARLHENKASNALEVHLVTKPELKIKPAIAIWAESKGGSLIETLYLSPEFAYSEEVNWQGIKTTRSKVLPIWRQRYTLLTGVDPEGKLDIMSGATSSHTFSLQKYLKTDADEYIIYLEINTAKDPNNDWPDLQLGQPSIIYSTYISHNDSTLYKVLELTAHSGLGKNNKHGTMNYDLSSLTSAREILELGLIKSTAPNRSKIKDF